MIGSHLRLDQVGVVPKLACAGHEQFLRGRSAGNARLHRLHHHTGELQVEGIAAGQLKGQEAVCHAPERAQRRTDALRQPARRSLTCLQ